jgi:hypothetical protein
MDLGISSIVDVERIIWIGDSAITSSSGDSRGVGVVISIEVLKASLFGNGEISMASCMGKGEDDAGSGGVVIQSRSPCY